MAAMRLLLVPLFLALASSGCGGNDALCSLEARSGVAVTLKDAATKQPVCDAKVIIIGPDVRDEAQPIGPDCLYTGASSAPGRSWWR